MVVIRIARGGTGSSPNAILDNQNNDFNAFFQDIDGIAVPANPAAGHRRLFVDSADDIIKVRTAAGATVSLEAGAGGGEANTSSNSGAGDGWALAKVGVDLPFKSLITSAPISTTVNANDLTLVLAALVNADIDAAAAIAYSKLNLTGNIVNADINAAAAIAQSKLSLDIVNANVNAAAAIAKTKIAAAGTWANSEIANLPVLGTLPSPARQTAILNAEISTVDASKITTGLLAIARGGTNSATAQAAIDTLSNVAAATNEHVLTKDTASGNAIFKIVGGASSPLTTKGDIFGFDTVDDRIPIGTNDQVLTADSAEGLGLKWATPAGGSGLTFAKVIKTVDETINSNTTLQDDDQLKFTPTINKTYHVLILLLMSSGATPDFKNAVSLPTGATAIRVSQAWSSTGARSTANWTTSQLIATAGNDQMLETHGRLIMSSTAGDFIFQWAQNVSDAGDTTVQEGSMLLAWEE